MHGASFSKSLSSVCLGHHSATHSVPQGIIHQLTQFMRPAESSAHTVYEAWDIISSLSPWCLGHHSSSQSVPCVWSLIHHLSRLLGLVASFINSLSSLGLGHRCYTHSVPQAWGIIHQLSQEHNWSSLSSWCLLHYSSSTRFLRAGASLIHSLSSWGGLGRQSPTHSGPGARGIIHQLIQFSVLGHHWSSY